MRKKLEAGFSLLEVIIAVAIIGILAGVATFVTLNQIQAADQAAAEDQVSNVYGMGEAVFVTGGQPPVGVAPPGSVLLLYPIGDTSVTYPMVLVGNSAESYCVDVYDNYGNTYFENASGLQPGLCQQIGLDSDFDGYSNQYEELTGSNPVNPGSTPWSDDDLDGFANIVETNAGTNGQNAGSAPSSNGNDSDGDGYSDVDEIRVGSAPNNSMSTPGDTDGNGQMDTGLAPLLSAP